MLPDPTGAMRQAPMQGESTVGRRLSIYPQPLGNACIQRSTLPVALVTYSRAQCQQASSHQQDGCRFWDSRGTRWREYV